MLDIVRNIPVQTMPLRSWNLSTVSDLFGEFDRLWNEITASLGSAPRAGGYAFDLYETDDSLVVEMAVPGLRKEDLEVRLEGNQLTVRGTYPEAPSNERRYWVRGLPRGNFIQSITLPASVEVDKIQATIADGLLRLSLPKVEQARVKRIAISAA
ncbi:MAG: Hsp20/alpha crystallin family protein [Meiothermus sp.]|uniref:Hsp20/alpha crystallin family protein n=1 Tax=Meiothermus sp. TaxID=1955249 RepID=UPI0025CBBC42|nr:Hsp20/alpha crystallin family protein [Meiothermus sp.]MCS7057880.1 Hsp20/alpha crystallin family protein [Meiothermus sp.]MCS7194244.1 Hsp20/alpha crystallin family protein [Meiothermus sp.]MCX7740466.1 Hsp20/alpha crystallin family protein [Meiothermus sp.]MDW8090822.1 Hsp20/alpha crystallin family protein [Meiothermus sp.]MDW8480756.1 Hsp20/alpha crystallin family protein [Meiothermus sp.]